VSRETKGRKGKGVTLVTGIPLDEKELKAFAKILKAKCGTGGTVKDGVIEIQGDQRDVLVPLLQAKGWLVKRSGG
jgi:translation initiation factor 1